MNKIIKEYKTKIPVNVANNFLSIHLDTDGTLTVFYQSSGGRAK